jgi:hypothetical protein
LSDTVGSQIGHFLQAISLGYEPEVLAQPVGILPNNPSVRDVLDPGESNLRKIAIQLIVGHEASGDPGRPGSRVVGPREAAARAEVGLSLSPDFPLALVDIDVRPAIRAGIAVYTLQYWFGQHAEYVSAFEAAVSYVRSLGAGGEVDIDELTRILDPIITGLDIPYQGEARAREGGSRVGNSIEDLRLSVLGFALGEAIRSGTFFADMNEAYRWIIRNVQEAPRARPSPAQDVGSTG